ncbi:MAG: hypothetical protein A2583_11905 [Bdellovibrionales bacterium RIFOXYD1_FULL_53_11]|nr:MAG: hypothetical protein A2583_11905 [Bdellovibrionales bacterium RIFOXYD1_FULL_53_11]
MCRPSKNHSHFLFGVRGVGKSTLIRSILKDKNVYWIDLLSGEDEFKYIQNPDLLMMEIEALARQSRMPAWVVIDEVQKAPKLLDLVHLLIEKHKLKFVLTGSSARKLKRGGANLLAGRAFVNHLFPLVHLELGSDFELDEYLRWGGLPELYSDQMKKTEDKTRFLKAYVNTYLKEEILVEQIVRKIEPFHHFLQTAAQCSGDIINFSKIADDAGTDDKSVERYYQILEDTLVGYHLLPFHGSVRKRQIKSSKFYFIDPGIIRALRGDLGNKPMPSSYEYGNIFENFIVGEIFKLNSYYEKDYRLSYVKTKDGVEIDLVIECGSRKVICVEIKSGRVASLDGFKAQIDLAGDIGCPGLVVLSQNVKAMAGNGITVFPWKEGIRHIFER